MSAFFRNSILLSPLCSYAPAHLHAVIKDTVRDESFVVAPLLLQSVRELESCLDVNTDKAVAFMLHSQVA